MCFIRLEDRDIRAQPSQQVGSGDGTGCEAAEQIRARTIMQNTQAICLQDRRQHARGGGWAVAHARGPTRSTAPRTILATRCVTS